MYITGSTTCAAVTDTLIVFINTMGCVFGPNTMAEEKKRAFWMYRVQKKGKEFLRGASVRMFVCFFVCFFLCFKGRQVKTAGLQGHESEVSSSSKRENREEREWEKKRDDRGRNSWIIHALLMLRISSCVMRAWCSKGDGKGEAVKDKVTASNNSFWLWGGRGGHTQEMSRRFPTPFFFQKGNPSISRLLHWAIVFDNVFYECAWMGRTKRENSGRFFVKDAHDPPKSL